MNKLFSRSAFPIAALVICIVTANATATSALADTEVTDAKPQGTSLQDANATVDMIYARSDELEKSVVEGVKASGSDEQVLTVLEKKVVAGFSDEQQIVTDKTVLSILNAWVAFDVKKSSTPKADKIKTHTVNYDQAKRFIETALPLLTNRVRFKMALLQREGDLLNDEGRPGDAAVKYSNAINALFPTPKVDVADLTLLRKSLRLAEVLRNLKSEDRAARLLAAILYYPTYAFPDEKTRAPFEALYVQAGRQIIRVYAGNLNRLTGLSFKQSSLKELKPELVRAVIAAGGKATDVQPDPPEGIDKIARGE